jgi:hypothetical protein
MIPKSGNRFSDKIMRWIPDGAPSGAAAGGQPPGEFGEQDSSVR